MTAKNEFPQTPGTRVRICGRNGITVAQSANLRGILDYARRSPVNVVELRDLGNGNYGVAFHFDNRCSALTCFADWRVALTFLAARRKWSVERISIEESLWPSVTGDALRWLTETRQRGAELIPWPPLPWRRPCLYWHSPRRRQRRPVNTNPKWTTTR